MCHPASLPAKAPVILHEVIKNLRASGHTVTEDAEVGGIYQINAGPALSLEAVIVLAWQLGLLIGPEGIQ